jgi:hypothetical protein
LLPPEALDRYEEDTLKLPSAIGVDIPAASEEALMKSLAPRPDDRFQTMQEFQEAIAGKIIYEKHTVQIIREYIVYCPHCLHENKVNSGANMEDLLCEYCGKPLKVMVSEYAATVKLPPPSDPVIIYKSGAGWKIAAAVLAIACVITGVS